MSTTSRLNPAHYTGDDGLIDQATYVEDLIAERGDELRARWKEGADQ
ncbi:hypothetical protein [Pseudactinotalea sp. Z1732]